MKLSIVILCWNDSKVILDCLKSIYAETSKGAFEVIVSDNGSEDGSVDLIRSTFPEVRIIQNNANFGFAKGNNAGFTHAEGQYVLFLNPDTVVLNHALDHLLAFADRHPEAGAFGCRVLNPDGSFQNPARPLPTVSSLFIGALCLRWLGRLSTKLESEEYVGWNGTTERRIGFQSGCCVMLRSSLLRELGGFDERFFYHFEETDLCFRVWKQGWTILYCPTAEVIHLGGQSVGRFPIRFALETQRGAYRYMYKHYGQQCLSTVRYATLIKLTIRRVGYTIRFLFRPSDALVARIQMYDVLLKWNWRLVPDQFITSGAEPYVGYEPLTPPPLMQVS